jgi:hypothetical protein
MKASPAMHDVGSYSKGSESGPAESRNGSAVYVIVLRSLVRLVMRFVVPEIQPIECCQHFSSVWGGQPCDARRSVQN